MIWRLNQVPVRSPEEREVKGAEIYGPVCRMAAAARRPAAQAVIQDAASGVVLMLVEVNQEALELMAATGRVHYYHPHKRKVVAKGEASGHFQDMLEIRLSCEGNQLILKVRRAGGACELGYQSCFFRRLGENGWENADPEVFDPAKSTRKSRFRIRKLRGEPGAKVPASPQETSS